jgi:hypothetical protein
MGSRTNGKQKRSEGRPVVVGVADHNGWANLVVVAAVNGAPEVVDRRRVPLIADDVPNQPYHHDTLALSATEGEQLLRRVKRSVAAATAAAFDRLSTELSPKYRVSSITIREAPLPVMPETVVEVHRSYYVFCRADAMLYHSAIVSAARQRGWDILFHRRGDELARAAAALSMDVDDVERFVNDLRLTLKSPWTAEHRTAFAAAIAGLGKQSRLRALRSDVNREA